MNDDMDTERERALRIGRAVIGSGLTRQMVHLARLHIDDAKRRSVAEHGGSVSSAMVVASCDDLDEALRKLADAMEEP